VYTPESRHPVEVTAAEQGHLVAWLSKRLGAEVRIPVLANLGYELVGGRLLPADDRPAAQFMYENAAGRRLTLYVRVFADGAQPTAFQQHRDGDLRVFYWVDGRFGYALTGPVTEAELLGAARLVYHELTPGERL
jgi:anti-sigma factor RsiW